MNMRLQNIHYVYKIFHTIQAPDIDNFSGTT